MNGLEPFRYAEQDVRVVMVDGDAWFVGADVARLLGYGHTPSAMRLLDEDMKGVRMVHTPGGDQEMTVLSEPGLYRLIMRSQRPEAKAIERWFVGTVLPTIRRTGSYAPAPAVPAIPETFADALQLAADQARKLQQQAVEIEVVTARAAELAPSARAWDQLASADGDYAVADAAKVLSRAPGIRIGRDRLFTLMSQRGWVYRHRSDGRWRVYQGAVESGYLSEMPSSHFHPRTGELVLDPPQVRVTVKGLRVLHAALSAASQLAIPAGR